MLRVRIVGLMLAIGLVTMLGAPPSPIRAGGARKAPAFQTPQAAFEAARKAAEKSDIKGIIVTLSDDNRDAFAGMMVIAGAFNKELAGKFAKTDEEKATEKATVQKVEAVLARHGITVEISKAALAAGLEVRSKEAAELLPILRKLVQPIKDRPAFVAEMMAAVTDSGPPFDQLKTSRLKDVTVNGDNAKGTEVTIMKDGKEVSNPIEFRKEAGSWKLHLDFLGKKKK